MESKTNAKNTSKSTSNSKEKTTVMHTKVRTIFGSTKNSLYIIKEHKYEIKKFPFPLDKEFFETEKSDEETNQKKTSKPTEKVSVEFSCENLLNKEEIEKSEKSEKNIKNHKNATEKPVEEIIIENIADEKNCEKENTAEDIDSQQDNANQCTIDMEEEDLNTASDLQKMSIELNAVFKHRLNDIELRAPNDLTLKLRTYQEWTDSLLKRNDAVIKSMNILKQEIAECFQITPVNADTRLRSYRDRDVLVRFIQEAFHSGDWNLDYLKLETVSLAEFLKKDLDKSSAESGSSHGKSSPTRRRDRQKRSSYLRTS